MDFSEQDFREENERYGKQFQRSKTKRASWIAGLSWAMPIYVAMVVCYAAYMFIKSKLLVIIFALLLTSILYSVKSRRDGLKKREDAKKKKREPESEPEAAAEDGGEMASLELTKKFEPRIIKIERALAKLVMMHETLAEKVDALIAQKEENSILDQFLGDDDDNDSSSDTNNTNNNMPQSDVRRRITSDGAHTKTN